MSFHMMDQSIHKPAWMKATNRTLRAVYVLLFGILLVACTSSPPPTNPSSQHNSSSNITSSSSIQPITYSTNPRDVLIRTFYGGGLYGSLSFGPNISIYGDGTYLLGIDRQGKL